MFNIKVLPEVHTKQGYHLPCTSEIPRSQPSLDSMIHVVYGSKVIESAAQQHDMLCNPTRYSCSKQELACLQA